MSAIPTKSRKLVEERSGGRCERCGMNGSDLHHRQRRRDGGHGAGNLVRLCRTDHDWVHANPEPAKARGFIIDPWVADPTTVPIRTYSEWVLFDNDGGQEFIQPPPSFDAREHPREREAS